VKKKKRKRAVAAVGAAAHLGENRIQRSSLVDEPVDPCEALNDEAEDDLAAVLGREAKADEQAQADVDSSPGDENIWCLKSGQQWHVIPDGAAFQLQEESYAPLPVRPPAFPTWTAMFSDNPQAELTPLTCFRAMWPQRIMDIMFTETKVHARGHVYLRVPTRMVDLEQAAGTAAVPPVLVTLTAAEMYQFIGACLGVGLAHGAVPREELWSTRPKGLHPAWNLGAVTGA
jgi:hypothetical protein